MKKEAIEDLTLAFEGHAQVTDSGIEFWLARDLQHLLGYAKWENFLAVLTRAKTACEVSGFDVGDHFPGVRKMVDIGFGASREIEDFMLSRYACYLVAQNGDPKKEAIAFAQTYFAVQTRKFEQIEQHIRERERIGAREKLRKTESELSSVIARLTGTESSFATIRSQGDQALFGKTTREMKSVWKVPANRPLADFAPTIVLKAKDFASQITIHNTEQENALSEGEIAREHVQNNSAVRKTLLDRGIRPEKLPSAEDIAKVERRLSSSSKKAFANPEPIPGEDAPSDS